MTITDRDVKKKFKQKKPENKTKETTKGILMLLACALPILGLICLYTYMAGIGTMLKFILRISVGVAVICVALWLIYTNTH